MFGPNMQNKTLETKNKNTFEATFNQYMLF